MTKLEVLPVLFRKGRTKDTAHEITAVFPTLPWNLWGDLTCYAHVGQHGSCSPGWYNETREAKPDEYADLLAELRGIYEDPKDEPVKLRVYRRMQPAHNRAREQERRRLMPDKVPT